MTAMIPGGKCIFYCVSSLSLLPAETVFIGFLGRACFTTGICEVFRLSLLHNRHLWNFQAELASQQAFVEFPGRACFTTGICGVSRPSLLHNRHSLSFQAELASQQAFVEFPG